jgi:cysteine desulfurase
MKNIYYDNSATTKVDPRVLEAMMPFLQDDYGNSGSIHTLGQNSLGVVDEARDKVADFLNCQSQEVIFTSGATESNNIAVQGVVENYLKEYKKVHIITSAIEHPAVLEVVKELGKSDLVEYDFLPVDEDGVIKIEKLPALIKDNTVLVSVMYVNNEVGSMQPIVDIGEIVKSIRKKRGDKGMKIYFHTDAVQAVNYLDCDVDKLGVDLLSFSGHKIYAPKGVGVLYVRKGVKLQPIAWGGHQEYNVRPGTLNVPGIAGLSKAIELVGQDRKKDAKKVLDIRKRLVSEIQKIENVRMNGREDAQVPNILNVSFLKAEGESILMMLDMENIAISTGSACSSGSLEPSHVLTAMGRPPEWSHGSIRISFGRFNTEVEVGPFVKVLAPVIKKLRDMAP